MFFAVVAHSEDIDTEGALDEIVEQCREKLGDRKPKAGILFSAIGLEHDHILEGIDDAWPGLELIGCTTDGEISSELGFREDSITLVLFGSDSIEFAAGLGRDVSKDIPAVCSRAVETARAKSTLPTAICITLPESMTTSAQQIVEALGQHLNANVPVLGATAGDGWRFESTRQFCGREVCSDSVPVLLLSGPLVYSIAVESGWEPVGEPGLVTRSVGNVLHEIDGRPATDFYRRFLGEQVSSSAEFPLAILDEHGEVECLRATVDTIDANKGAITFFADIREGALVQITSADRSAILEGCTASVRKAFADYPHGKSPEAALFFSCAARKLLLGTRTAEEYVIVESVIGTQVPVCGFYGYGEIGPRHTNDDTSKFHNETFVSLVMGT
ncbi:MAG: FIST signal transduction protein [Alphaproteobacteria bacterium]